VDNLVSPSQTSPLTKDPSKDASETYGATSAASAYMKGLKSDPDAPAIDQDLATRLDKHSLEAIVELKISRFLDQIGSYYPEDLHSLIMKKVEKPLLGQILRRTGGNQVHASKILGINRNTLRKKMKLFGFSS
jgi:DNA-binding protein Fis